MTETKYKSLRYEILVLFHFRFSIVVNYLGDLVDLIGIIMPCSHGFFHRF